MPTIICPCCKKHVLVQHITKCEESDGLFVPIDIPSRKCNSDLEFLLMRGNNVEGLGKHLTLADIEQFQSNANHAYNLLILSQF